MVAAATRSRRKTTAASRRTIKQYTPEVTHRERIRARTRRPAGRRLLLLLPTNVKSIVTVSCVCVLWGISLVYLSSFSSALHVPLKSLPSSTTTTTGMMNSNLHKVVKSVRRVNISEHVWRKAADDHARRILDILRPGLRLHHPNQQQHQKHSISHHDNNKIRKLDVSRDDDFVGSHGFALDPKHPVYNFLVEYYGLKGSKGVRRLTRWSPSPRLLLLSSIQQKNNDAVEEDTKVWRIERHEELIEGSEYDAIIRSSSRVKMSPPDCPVMWHEILLEGACEDDFGAGRLHLRGVKTVDDDGVLYCPTDFFDGSSSDEESGHHNKKATEIQLQRKVSSFLWYQSILQQTSSRDPILHCYNLHEWAMQYRPPGAPIPPSSKYQSHLPLRVSQQVINETVERKGVSCTHVDALRFFAEDAVRLNKYGEDGKGLQRHEQPHLEQPGCLHAQMDLLKMYLKLQPFVDPILLVDVLEIALEARTLDVAASPYDASSFGVQAIPIETHDGRALYRDRQTKLYHQSQAIRHRMMQAYDDFLELTTSSMGKDAVSGSQQHLPVSDEMKMANL